MYNGELMHYGVLGMKWGHRKNARVDSAKSEYKSAKKDLALARKEYRKSSKNAFGIKQLERAQNARYKIGDAEIRRIDAKAKYKAAKAKTSAKAAKAEFKTYRKEMQKTGLVGSAADSSANGRSTAIYNHLVQKKGKAYADAVHKKVQNVAVSEFAVAATVAVGSTFVSAYLANK